MSYHTDRRMAVIDTRTGLAFYPVKDEFEVVETVMGHLSVDQMRELLAARIKWDEDEKERERKEAGPSLHFDDEEAKYYYRVNDQSPWTPIGEKLNYIDGEGWEHEPYAPPEFQKIEAELQRITGIPADQWFISDLNSG